MDKYFLEKHSYKYSDHMGNQGQLLTPIPSYSSAVYWLCLQVSSY